MSELPPAAPRRQVHLRRISCEAFDREDGLIDIEGLLIDTKPTDIQLVTGKSVEAGAAIHRMSLRLTVNRERWIVDACARSEAYPYGECKDAEAAYRKLVGVRIESGFTLKVKQMFKGEAGCTHITELIPPMATTLFQVLWADSEFDNKAQPMASSPLGACHGLRQDGHVVRTYFSDHKKEVGS